MIRTASATKITPLDSLDLVFMRPMMAKISAAKDMPGDKKRIYTAIFVIGSQIADGIYAPKRLNPRALNAIDTPTALKRMIAMIVVK